MTDAAGDLICLVSCALRGEAPAAERVEAMDLSAVYQEAQRHSLAAAAAAALARAGVRDERFIRAAQHAMLKCAAQDLETDAVLRALDGAGIWYAPLKGRVLQHLYPAYGMREMSDHDILFDASRAQDVRALMEGLGFRAAHFGAGHHDSYRKPPVCHIEMHRALFGPGHREKLRRYYAHVECRMVGEGTEKRFLPEDFYLYLVAHAYKHYVSGGMGLRALADFYVALNAQPLDMVYIAAEAEKMGIADFEAAARSLALRLFGGEPITDGDREMLSYILSSGKGGTVRHQVENRLRSRGLGRWRYALGRLAVPLSPQNKNYAKFSSGYPFFYRHKALLPLLPPCRFFRALLTGRMAAEARALFGRKGPNQVSALKREKD